MANTRTNIIAATLIPDSENGRLIMILDDRRMRIMPINPSAIPQSVAINQAAGGDAAIDGTATGNCTAVGGAAVIGGAAAVGGTTVRDDVTTGGCQADSGGIARNINVTVGDDTDNYNNTVHYHHRNVIYLPLMEDELDWDYCSEIDYEEREDDDDSYDDYEDDYYPPSANENANIYK